MLKKLYKLITSNTGTPTPVIVQDNEHSIEDAAISRSALRVIAGLKDAGYSAYLVGGGVRDLLLGGHPKDFDVATNATPEQVKSVFRSAHIIGRRFRIVHVRFGREIIEVTTFRGTPEKSKSAKDHSRSDKGMLLRDNVYGDIESDALRRDFSVNALYYSPDDGQILDFTGGLADLDKRQLRLIGDPDARYKEDPVRMLRAVRFCCKLGFSLTPDTERPIHEHTEYLQDIPPARLFEEVLKLFLSGSSTAVLTKLHEFDLLKYLFPGAALHLKNAEGYYHKLLFSMTSNTDKRLRTDKRVSPAFIYAAMLWPPLHATMRELQEVQAMSAHEAMQQAAQGVISQQLAHTSIPKRFLLPMRDIWHLQQRLTRRDGRRAHLTMEHPRFRAAYDFVLLREEAGEDLDGLGMWWTRFQSASEQDRNQMVGKLGGGNKRRGRRPRRRKPSNSPPAPDA